jgi:hypothetical protein
MRAITMLLFWTLLFSPALADDFFRPIPDTKFSAQLTQDKFPHADGVIIIKEQSLNVHRAEASYHGIDLVGVGMTSTTELIVKVFNNAAVHRFGSFEYEYYEYFGDDIPSGFMARARVQKPDGTVIEMPKEDVTIVVSQKDNDGEPLARKAMFKIPNLMPGDVIQLEYVLSEPFVRAYSGIFYFQDQLPILFSNLAITCQQRDEVRVFSFPAERIGEPTISQIATALGSGETRFWSVKNLNGIPHESHGPPFEELSIMTAFVADERFHKQTDWDELAKNYWSTYLDKGSVDDDYVKELGVQIPRGPVTLEKIDSLYTALRTAIVLSPVNRLYPLVKDLEDVFKKKSGDASDLAAIFYKVLQDWKVDVHGVWLRDRREGGFESTVPTLQWFDRLGVLVTVGGEKILYDFDRAIPNHFVTPWFLKGVTAMMIDKAGCHPFTVPAARPGEAWVRESHDLTFSDRLAVRDSMTTTGKGAPIENWREDAYTLKGPDLTSYFRKEMSTHCIESESAVQHSAIFDTGEAWVTIAGGSKSAVATIDSFVSVRPVNHLLKSLGEDFLVPSRTNDVVLDEPYTMTLEWTIHHPPGYVLAAVPRDSIMPGFPGGLGSYVCKRTGDDVRMTASLELTTQIIPTAEYNNLVRLLVRLQGCTEQAVTFRKKK